MRKAPALLLAASMIGILMTAPVLAADEKKKEETGQEIAFDKSKGNCLACHAIPGDPKAITLANIGPPLIAMNTRFPNKSRLREQIWDATKFNVSSAMPPFGKHKILTEQEIDKVVDYVYGL
jgi:sulfur-oxidizing protein SoxX